jgi:NosR/NirI family nitrous oxide reductase transcriptional regulator
MSRALPYSYSVAISGIARFLFASLLIRLATLASPNMALAQLEKADLEPFVTPPFSIGEPPGEKGVWELLNSCGALVG